MADDSTPTQPSTPAPPSMSTEPSAPAGRDPEDLAGILEVTDPHRLRALAHPLRMQLLRLIRQNQPATGARLAELTGESTASVSYHLSVLHKHGYIEPDPVPGPTRRHKPWRTTYESLRIEAHHRELPPSQTVEGAILGPLLTENRRLQDAYFEGSSGLAGAWAEVGTFELTDLVLTEPEFDRLTDEVGAVLARYRGAGQVGGDRARISVSFIAIPTVTGPAQADESDQTNASEQSHASEQSRASDQTHDSHEEGTTR
jgi:DNA-binding transcriptional ArsR family regulator